MSEKRFKNLYNNSPDMYLSVTIPECTVIQCNNTLLKNLGYKEQEIIGKPVYQLYSPSVLDELKVTLENFIINGYIRNKELVVRRKDGSEIYISLSTEAVRDKNNQILYTISTWRDINEKKEQELVILQQNMRLSNLIADKDKFISILAHDLKSPFTSLLGLTELLIKHIDKYDKEKLKERLGMIYTSANLTYTLLEDLLSWSKAQAGKITLFPQTIDLNEIVSEIIELYTFQIQSKSIRIVNNLNMTTLFADENIIKTVFRNLISNAIKFSYQEGTIQIGNTIKENFILFSISDNGTGMENSFLQNLWKNTNPHSRSGTNGESGTGLGLILCKAFIEKHNGCIWAESKVNEGSTFSFSIPLSSKNQ